MKEIRVLCVMSTLERGGAESMCMNIYRAIDRSKIQFDFVKHTHTKGAFEDEIQELGGHIYEAPRYRIINHFSYSQWWKQHFRVHPEHRIVHGHFYTIASVYLGIAKKQGRTTIGHAHTDKELSFIKKIYTDRLEDVCDYCFACSQKAGERYFPHKEFKIIKNPIDVNKFRFNAEKQKSIKKELGLESNFIVGTVGRIFEPKNPEAIVRIFAEVRRIKSNSVLLWVGDGPDKKMIEELVRELHIDSSVKFLGVRGDVDSLMQSMDAFILPSIREGFPLVLVEAQAAAIPCYISDRISDEVRLTNLCHVLPLDDFSAWAKAIVTTIQPKKDISSLIKEKGYDSYSVAKNMEEFYSRCKG